MSPLREQCTSWTCQPRPCREWPMALPCLYRSAWEHTALENMSFENVCTLRQRQCIEAERAISKRERKGSCSLTESPSLCTTTTDNTCSDEEVEGQAASRRICFPCLEQCLDALYARMGARMAPVLLRKRVIISEESASVEALPKRRRDTVRHCALSPLLSFASSVRIVSRKKGVLHRSLATPYWAKKRSVRERETEIFGRHLGVRVAGEEGDRRQKSQSKSLLEEQCTKAQKPIERQSETGQSL